MTYYNFEFKQADFRVVITYEDCSVKFGLTRTIQGIDCVDVRGAPH